MCVKDKIENKLDEIAERSNGIITAEVLAENGFSKYFIRKLEKSGSIYKYHHGIYMADGYLPDDCYLFQGIYKDVGKTIVITNGFVKKQQKTPPKEISLAKERRADFLRRNKGGEMK